LMPNFSADNPTDCLPLGVQFTDETPGLVNTWAWAFPGGDPSDSDLQNPFVTYNTPGIYDVILSVENGFGGISITYANLIMVGEVPIASFDSESTGLDVTFTNTSQFADNYLWDFGDGSTFSVLENPTHSYTTPGSYEVALTVSNEFCVGEVFTASIEVGPSATIDLQKEKWRIYPNPVKEFTTISSDEFVGELELSLFDITGKELRREQVFFDKQILLETESLTSGVYFLKLDGGDGTQVFKLIR